MEAELVVIGLEQRSTIEASRVRSLVGKLSRATSPKISAAGYERAIKTDPQSKDHLHHPDSGWSGSMVNGEFTVE